MQIRTFGLLCLLQLILMGSSNPTQGQRGSPPGPCGQGGRGGNGGQGIFGDGGGYLEYTTGENGANASNGETGEHGRNGCVDGGSGGTGGDGGNGSGIFSGGRGGDGGSGSNGGTGGNGGSGGNGSLFGSGGRGGHGGNGSNGGKGGEGGKGGSCLKAGTKILMADLTEKAVELLEIGDLVMDVNLKPVKVLGVTYDFLKDQKFYGFENDKHFFTQNHLFLGPSATNELSMYAKNVSHLYHFNPLMRYEAVSEFGRDSETNLFHFTRSDGVAVPETKPVKIYEDSTVYPMDTPIYYIQVEGLTYYANGYACILDAPPVQHWPNTMSLFFRLMETDNFKAISQTPFNLNTAKHIEAVVTNLTASVQGFVDQQVSNNWGSINENERMTLSEFNLEERISKLFTHPATAALGIELYARLGPILAPHLDSAAFNAKDEISDRMCQIQHDLFNLINEGLHRLSMQ